MVSSITVYSDKTSFAIGEKTSLFATVFFTNGAAVDVSDLATWESLDNSKISVSGNTATALDTGATYVSASYQGFSKSVLLVPFSAVLNRIELSVQSLSLPVDGETVLRVSAIYDNGLSVDVTDSCVYSITDESVAIVNESGVITSQAAGTTSLNVSYHSESVTLDININSSTISSIQVTPIIGSKSINEQQQFEATATLDDGSKLDITNSVVWSSADESIIDINGAGVASLVSAGTTSINATYQLFSNSVNFQVLDKSIASLELILSSTSISVGISTALICIATYSDGSTEDITASVQLESSSPEVALVSNHTHTKGVVSSLGVGATTLSASIAGVTNSTELTVTTASLVSIAVESESSLLSANINAYFSAKGTFDDGSVVDITDTVTWELSDSQHGTISNSSGARGLFNNNFSQSSTQELTVTAGFHSVTGSKKIILAPGSISSISINPSQAILNMGQNTPFKAYAHFSDGASVDITDIATWSSSEDTIAMVSNSKLDGGYVSAISEGLVNLQASYKGLNSEQSSIDVDNSVSPQVEQDGTGLSATYFTGNNFDAIAGQRIDSTVNFNWSTGQAPLGVGDYFSVRWEGQIRGKVTGDCTIASRSDDGFRVTIGGTTYLDIWFPHGPRWDYNYSVPFVEGEKQNITVEFFENGGHAVAELYWECPGDTQLEVIPTIFLYTN